MAKVINCDLMEISQVYVNIDWENRKVFVDEEELGEVDFNLYRIELSEYEPEHLKLQKIERLIEGLQDPIRSTGFGLDPEKEWNLLEHIRKFVRAL